MTARTVSLVFCAILQVVSCQDDDGTIINLEDLITETFNQVTYYASNVNIQTALNAFNDETRIGNDRIGSVTNRTKFQLLDLASALNQNNYDVSDCLVFALKNISNTVYETIRKLQSNVLTLNRYIENSEYGPTDTEMNSLFEELRLLNSDCMILGNVDKVNLCINELITEMNDGVDIIERTMYEAEPLILAKVDESREIQTEYMDEFEVSIENTIQATAQELTACINKL